MNTEPCGKKGFRSEWLLRLAIIESEFILLERWVLFTNALESFQERGGLLVPFLRCILLDAHR